MTASTSPLRDVSVPCSVCRAATGKPCTDYSGRPRAPHDARVCAVTQASDGSTGVETTPGHPTGFDRGAEW